MIIIIQLLINIFDSDRGALLLHRRRAGDETSGALADETGRDIDVAMLIIYIYIYIHIYIYTWLHVCMYIRIHVYVELWLHG